MEYFTNTEISKTVVTKIYEILKQKIISLEFKLGQKIDMQKLAEDFGVSQTPIRTVLDKLSKDKLITYKPRKGYYIVNLTVKDMEEIYEQRKMIESYALKQGIDNIDRNKIRELLDFETKLKKETKNAKKINKHRYVDRELHLLIVKSFNNRKIYEFYLNIYPFVEISQQLDPSYERSIDEHILLLKAILNGNIEEALHILESHIDNCEHDGLAKFHDNY